MAVFVAVFLAVLTLVYWRVALVMFAVLLIALFLLGLATAVDSLRPSVAAENQAPHEVSVTVIS